MAAVEGKGKHRSIVQRRELLARQRQSGLSVAAFCRERSLSSESFYRWRRELAGTDAAPAGLAERAGFIELGSLGSNRFVAGVGGRTPATNRLRSSYTTARSHHPATEPPWCWSNNRSRYESNP
ncbi:MAG: transposase [Gammaproteobacteria bacterium]|nr:transposase [Gammaproteobacteria bacterium]